ncbi:MAG: ATP-binding cassette domain-containing protein [Lutibacter sp.]|nr:ATP-binding cassette domain-containing protein [Lutibacter sp.]MDT8416729.1 ATP-binding cassette domain-containing protein [Lutibacter sp.]
MKNSQETSTDNLSEEKITSETLIEIRNLKKSFGRLEVLKDISLKLRNGENLVVLGKSGSGKSVLIKCIVRLLNPDGGTINLLSENVGSIKGAALSEVRKKIGFLFQSGALYDSMTVKQNLEFPLRRIKKNLNEQEIDEKVKEVLANVGLSDVLEKMPSQLSGGMRKRISLARSIILDPVIMLYDEPTTGLDPVTSDEISELINSVQEKYKTSSIIITHDIACVRLTADRIIMLHEGHVYAEGKLSEFENSDDPLVMSFFK